MKDGYNLTAWQIYLKAVILAFITTAQYAIGIRILFGKNPELDTLSIYLLIGIFSYWIILGIEAAINYLKND